MGEAAYNAAVMGPLARWLKLAGSQAPFRLPLVGPEGGRVLFMQDGDLTDLCSRAAHAGAAPHAIRAAASVCWCARTPANSSAIIRTCTTC